MDKLGMAQRCVPAHTATQTMNVMHHLIHIYSSDQVSRRSALFHKSYMKHFPNPHTNTRLNTSFSLLRMLGKYVNAHTIIRFVCVCVCVYTHTHTHTYIHIMCVCGRMSDTTRTRRHRQTLTTRAGNLTVLMIRISFRRYGSWESFLLASPEILRKPYIHITAAQSCLIDISS
jgi:hypothetical protein